MRCIFKLSIAFGFFLYTPIVSGTTEANDTSITARNGQYIQLCGFTRDSGEPFGYNRIVGGVNAEKHEFKWQVSIQWKYRTATYHVCGASIIGRTWLLTAAHCTADFRMKDLVFVAADHRLKKNEGEEQVLTAAKIIQHEKYNPVTQENDISLIRTKDPFNFNLQTMAPVCLPEPGQTFTGSCLVTGWGKLREGGSNSDVLQKVWLPIISDKDCKAQMKSIGYSGPVKDTMICAGFKEGGQDACQGDSGGPFVCPGPGDLPILVGIVSWGIGCARKNIPGVYTEISHYVNWINTKVGENTRKQPFKRPNIASEGDNFQEFGIHRPNHRVFYPWAPTISFSPSVPRHSFFYNQPPPNSYYWGHPTQSYYRRFIPYV